MSGVADDLGLIDHHCHGVTRTTLDRPAFESMLNEADGPGRWHGSMFDTQVGLGVRAMCAERLGLPRFAEPDEYLAGRATLDPAEVNRRMLDGLGIEQFLVADQPSRAAGDTDAVALMPAHQMRRGMDMGGKPCGLDQRAGEGGGRTLAVGAGNVDDRRHPVLRPAELIEQASDTVE